MEGYLIDRVTTLPTPSPSKRKRHTVVKYEASQALFLAPPKLHTSARMHEIPSLDLDERGVEPQDQGENHSSG